MNKLIKVDYEAFRKTGITLLLGAVALLASSTLFLVGEAVKFALFFATSLILSIVGEFLIIISRAYLTRLSFVSNWFLYAGLIGVIAGFISLFEPIILMIPKPPEILSILSIYYAVFWSIGFIFHVLLLISSFYLDLFNNSNVFKVITSITLFLQMSYGVVIGGILSFLTSFSYIIDFGVIIVMNYVVALISGFVLIALGIAFTKVYEDLESVLFRSDVTDKIKNDIEKSLEAGETVHIIAYARSIGLKPLHVLIKAYELISKDEISGYVYREKIIPREYKQP